MYGNPPLRKPGISTSIISKKNLDNVDFAMLKE